jgi:hemoglobin
MGGDETIRAAVHEFCNRMLLDDRVNHHLIGINVDSLRKKITTFIMSWALNGKPFDQFSLRKAHAGLNITSEEYNIAMKHMVESFRTCSVDLEDIARVEAYLRFIKPHIIHK